MIDQQIQATRRSVNKRKSPRSRHCSRRAGTVHRLRRIACAMPRVLLPAHASTALVAGRLPRWLAGSPCAVPADPLPSWNDGAVKTVHHRFRRAGHDEGGADFVPPPSASRRSTTTARCGPSSRSISRSPSRSTASRRWRPASRNGRSKQPFKAVLEGDKQGAGGAGEKGLLKSWRRPMPA